MRLVVDDLIKNSGLKKSYVAEKIGVNRDTITNWCKNETMPKLDKAVELAELLGVDVNDLFEHKK
ncbi:helix-turn-helix transcriptional regulator [Virgibacillus sp. C22-A2]|uniref:Helix-turn-helix transcriptional regulator n=1 Tax=Virgibacillus tibetensis TaxID=3042313 RepID=A0ABU6KBI8_9BACI|nr:helix-turn-helix transcriptional regulator [Virgibacillus sp. C22-A2]